MKGLEPKWISTYLAVDFRSNALGLNDASTSFSVDQAAELALTLSTLTWPESLPEAAGMQMSNSFTEQGIRVQRLVNRLNVAWKSAYQRSDELPKCSVAFCAAVNSFIAAVLDRGAVPEDHESIAALQSVLEGFE